MINLAWYKKSVENTTWQMYGENCIKLSVIIIKWLPFMMMNDAL